MNKQCWDNHKATTKQHQKIPSKDSNKKFRGPTPQRVGWTVTGPSLAGRLHSLGFCQWVSSRKSHTTRRRGHLRVAISTVSDPSGSGGVDIAHGHGSSSDVVATGAWANRNTTCIRYLEVWELKLYFYPSAGGFSFK